MENKELLTVEFRYMDKPGSHDGGYRSKTITIGVFDSIKDAIIEGNKVLSILSEKFQVRSDDVFALNGLFGKPKRLVTNTCYPTNNIEYFAKITPLIFDDLNDTITETFEAFKRYRKHTK